MHSAVDAPGPTSLFGYFSRADVTVESHFFIKLDGTIEQYMDTNVRADANYKANPRAVSIETEDDGNPDARKWTPAQVQSLKRLMAWLFVTHPKILRRMCPAWNKAGVGYHSMWGAPSPWTPVAGKTCPGNIRKVQWWAEIEPWLRSGSAAPAAPKKSTTTSGVCDVKVRVLKRGMKGGDVRSLQILLRSKAGQNIAVDGDFGPATERAVRNVQRFFKLKDDGIVGAATWPTLFL